MLECQYIIATLLTFLIEARKKNLNKSLKYFYAFKNDKIENVFKIFILPIFLNFININNKEKFLEIYRILYR